MLVKIMMWASIVVVLLALLGLPVMGGTILVETVLCVSALLVSCQAFRWVGLTAFLVAAMVLKTKRTLSMPLITNRDTYS